MVERTIAWIGRYRRLSQAYESLPEGSEVMIDLAMSRLVLRRLAAKRRTACPAAATGPQRVCTGFLNSLY